MHYLLMLVNAPDAWQPADRVPGSADDDVAADWTAYTRALHAAGVLVGGHALGPADTATTVRVRNGRRLLTDGPFADTEEHLLGYYLIDVPDLDAALQWAARVPNVRTGAIEVRPVTPGSGTDDVLRTGVAPGDGPPG